MKFSEMCLTEVERIRDNYYPEMQIEQTCGGEYRLIALKTVGDKRHQEINIFSMYSAEFFEYNEDENIYENKKFFEGDEQVSSLYKEFFE